MLDVGDMDYVVLRGRVYDVVRDGPDRGPFLRETDEVPQQYWERWPEAAGRGRSDPLADVARRLEGVEDGLARLVREANDDVEESTVSAVIAADEVDDLRQELTDARADLVDELLDRNLEGDEE